MQIENYFNVLGLIAIVVFLVLSVFSFNDIRKKLKTGKLKKKQLKTVWVVPLFKNLFFGGVCSFALLIVSYLVLLDHYSSLNKAVYVDANDRYLGELPKGLVLFKFQDYKGRKIVSCVAQKLSVDSSINPITVNPKVRSLKCSIDIVYLGTGHAWRDYQEFKKEIAESDSLDKTLAGWITYQLVEFNEKNSRVLATFYNENSASQQKEFDELLASHFRELFDGKGVRFAKATFSIQ